MSTEIEEVRQKLAFYIHRLAKADEKIDYTNGRTLDMLDFLVDRYANLVDTLLNHTHDDTGECQFCSELICPHKCPLHFHHDGCPACVEDDFIEGAIMIPE